MFTIKPVDEPGSYRTSCILGLTETDISGILGFVPNIEGDPEKVQFSWGAIVLYDDGTEHYIGIWDYKGSAAYREFSAYGPRNVLIDVFGEEHVS